MMSTNPFTTRFEDLPHSLPIFPLPNAVLLPRQRLPLNIFEPRYLSMVQDALRADRHIGMIQPNAEAARIDPAPVYKVGCAGRITTFQESEDGRFLIQLTGVCRFEVLEEIAQSKGYRRVLPGWQAFRADFEEPPEPPLGLDQLEGTLKSYFQANQLEASWDQLRQLPAAHLVDFLATNLPFEVEEKQALVEASSVVERARFLQSALEMAVRSSSGANETRH